jgi:hypothetical protein
MNEFKGGGRKAASRLEPKMSNPQGAGSRKETNVLSPPGKKRFGSNEMSPVAKEGRRVPYGGETY